MMEITLIKKSTEMKKLLCWLVETIEHGQWETSPVKTAETHVLFNVAAKNSKKWEETVAKYTPNNTGYSATFIGRFWFKNPKDAMLFKLRWA